MASIGAEGADQALPPPSHREARVVTFNIEIIRADGQVIFRVTVNEVIPERLKKRAAEMLRYHRKRGATEALVSSESGEELYKL